MGLDHLSHSSAILLQFASRLAQEPLTQGTENPTSTWPTGEAGSCGQADNSLLHSALLAQKEEETCQPAGRQEQQRYQGYPLLICLTLWSNNSG